MKKQIKLNRLFISMLMLGCSLGFVACSDDDETTPTPPVEVTQIICLAIIQEKCFI